MYTVVIFLFTPSINCQEYEAGLSFDLTDPQTVKDHIPDIERSIIPVDNGLIPSEISGENGWKLTFLISEPLFLNANPYLKVELIPAHRQAFDIEVRWKHREITLNNGQASVRVVTPILENGKPNLIWIDLRQNPMETWDEINDFDLFIKPRDYHDQYPTLKGIGFYSPSPSRWFHERCQRASSLNYSQASLLLVSILIVSISIFGGIFLKRSKIGVLGYRKLTFKIFILLLFVIWGTMSGLFWIENFLKAPRTLAKNLPLSMHELRYRRFEDCYALMETAKSLIPEDTEVCIKSNEKCAPFWKHYANYCLYPREISDSLDADYIMVCKLNKITREHISELRHQGYYLLAAIDEWHYIFSKEKPDHETEPWHPLFSNATVSVTANSKKVGYAYDQKPETRWSTGRPMQPGDYIEIDLKKPIKLSGVRYWHGDSWKDHPRYYRFRVANDNTDWITIDKGPCHILPLGYLEVLFEPMYVQYLKLEQTGMHPAYFWSIHEIELQIPGDIP